MVAVFRFARGRDYPADSATGFGDDPDTVVMRGGSCIIGPLGNVLTGPDFTGETILTAECELDDIIRGKYDFDVVGHYSRPDCVEFNVVETGRQRAHERRAAQAIE